MLGIEFIEFDNKLFRIIRKIKESSNPIIETWKEHLRSDIVLKKDGMFYFCELVPEAEIIEESTK
jgi:hypothetical protein